MSEVNQVYLKDENDNIVSPITSVDSVYDSNRKSNRKLYCRFNLSSR